MTFSDRILDYVRQWIDIIGSKNIAAAHQQPKPWKEPEEIKITALLTLLFHLLQPLPITKYQLYLGAKKYLIFI